MKPTRARSLARIPTTLKNGRHGPRERTLRFGSQARTIWQRVRLPVFWVSRRARDDVWHRRRQRFEYESDCHHHREVRHSGLRRRGHRCRCLVRILLQYLQSLHGWSAALRDHCRPRTSSGGDAGSVAGDGNRGDSGRVRCRMDRRIVSKEQEAGRSSTDRCRCRSCDPSRLDKSGCHRANWGLGWRGRGYCRSSVLADVPRLGIHLAAQDRSTSASFRRMTFVPSGSGFPKPTAYFYRPSPTASLHKAVKTATVASSLSRSAPSLASPTPLPVRKSCGTSCTSRRLSKRFWTSAVKLAKISKCGATICNWRGTGGVTKTATWQAATTTLAASCGQPFQGLTMIAAVLIVAGSDGTSASASPPMHTPTTPEPEMVHD